MQTPSFEKFKSSLFNLQSMDKDIFKQSYGKNIFFTPACNGLYEDYLSTFRKFMYENNTVSEEKYLNV
jgi:hypothetical protein